MTAGDRRSLPRLPPQFAKLAALYRSSTFAGERATARRKVLALANTTMAIRKLDDDECALKKIETADGCREVNIISEPGLYKLVGRSSKPVAKRFDRWVRHEVLPSIRKTGSYTIRREGTAEGPEYFSAPSADDPRMAELLRLPLMQKVELAAEVRRAWGPAAEREIWVLAGIPVTAAMPTTGLPHGATDADALDEFVMGCIRERPGARVQARAMYRAYEAWSHAGSRRPVTETMFGRLMRGRLRRDNAGAVHAYLDCELHDVPAEGDAAMSGDAPELKFEHTQSRWRVVLGQATILDEVAHTLLDFFDCNAVMGLRAEDDGCRPQELS